MVHKGIRKGIRSKRLSAVQNEARFLAGRHSRFYELTKVLRIAREFIRGTLALHSIGPAVTVFGSSRILQGHPFYELARQMGSLLARRGFTVMTGGGPGLMEAANRGAKEAGGHSIGCTIELPQEREPNLFLDRVVTFYYFFVRKVMLVKYSYAFVILPGGLGTLDEATEAMTLIQTGKLYDFPVILMGSDYWRGIHDWIHDTAVQHQTLSSEDLGFLHFTDDPQEAMEIIERTANGLKPTAFPLKSVAD